MDSAINNLINQINTSLQTLAGQYLLPGAGVICITIIIYGGIQYITGGPKGAETGKKTVVAALIGLIIIVLAWTIINFVANGLF